MNLKMNYIQNPLRVYFLSFLYCYMIFVEDQGLSFIIQFLIIKVHNTLRRSIKKAAIAQHLLRFLPQNDVSAKITLAMIELQ